MEKHDDFFPSGAVSFFLLMIAFYVLLWLLVFKLLLDFS